MRFSRPARHPQIPGQTGDGLCKYLFLAECQRTHESKHYQHKKKKYSNRRLFSSISCKSKSQNNKNTTNGLIKGAKLLFISQLKLTTNGKVNPLAGYLSVRAGSCIYLEQGDLVVLHKTVEPCQTLAELDNQLYGEDSHLGDAAEVLLRVVLSRRVDESLGRRTVVRGRVRPHETRARGGARTRVWTRARRRTIDQRPGAGPGPESGPGPGAGPETRGPEARGGDRTRVWSRARRRTRDQRPRSGGDMTVHVGGTSGERKRDRRGQTGRKRGAIRSSHVRSVTSSLSQSVVDSGVSRPSCLTS